MASRDSGGDYKMPIGKWKGYTFEDIQREDPKYLRFVANLSPDEESPHADVWLEARDAAKAYLANPTAFLGVEYVREPRRSIVCTKCSGYCDFSDVLMLTAEVIAIKCACSPMPLRSNKNHPRYDALVAQLLTGWEGVAIPYVAAEYPALPCPATDFKWGRFTLQMLAVDTAEDFLARCKRDDERALPLSADPDDA